jgi:hypothetical protein
MAAMTRPLTKRELALVAKARSLQAEPEFSIPAYLIAIVGLGVAVSLIVSGLVLLTDTLGLRSLIMSDPSPVEAAFTLVLGCGFALTPLVVATAVGFLAARPESAKLPGRNLGGHG